MFLVELGLISSCDHDKDDDASKVTSFNKNQDGCLHEIQFLQSNFLKNTEFYHKFRYNNEFIWRILVQVTG